MSVFLDWSFFRLAGWLIREFTETVDGVVWVISGYLVGAAALDAAAFFLSIAFVVSMVVVCFRFATGASGVRSESGRVLSVERTWRRLVGLLGVVGVMLGFAVGGLVWLIKSGESEAGVPD